MLEFNYELRDPFEYQKDGQTIAGTTLTLSQPGYKNRSQCQRLKELFEESVDYIRIKESNSVNSHKNESGKKEPDTDEDTELSPKDIIDLFLASSVSIKEAMTEFDAIMTSGICKVDNSQNLNNVLLSKMSLHDIETVYGKYYTFFLI